jgi:flagellar biosynthetic protein FliR
MGEALFGLEFERQIVAMGLASARTMPVAWLIPAFGGPHVPAQVRVGLGLALGALCFPLLAGQVPDVGPVLWMLLMVREIAVGVTLGFLASLVFRAAEMGGRLIDIARGANMAEVISPLSGERTSPLGNVTLLLAVVMFFEIGGLGHVAAALVRSYEAVPIAASASPAALGHVAHLVILSSAHLLEAALGLAAPALVALLLVDVALGAIGRVAPQIPLYFVGMPLKALVGVGAVLLSLGVLHAVLAGEFREWAQVLARAIEAWR